MRKKKKKKKEVVNLKAANKIIWRKSIPIKALKFDFSFRISRKKMNIVNGEFLGKNKNKNKSINEK